jgi:hypothetical protein
VSGLKSGNSNKKGSDHDGLAEFFKGRLDLDRVAGGCDVQYEVEYEQHQQYEKDEDGQDWYEKGEDQQYEQREDWYEAGPMYRVSGGCDQ